MAKHWRRIPYTVTGLALYEWKGTSSSNARFHDRGLEHGFMQCALYIIPMTYLGQLYATA